MNSKNVPIILYYYWIDVLTHLLYFHPFFSINIFNLKYIWDIVDPKYI